MKKILLSFTLIIILTSCNNTSKTNDTNTNSGLINNSTGEIVNQETNKEIKKVLNDFAKASGETSPKIKDSQFDFVYSAYKYSLNGIEAEFLELKNMGKINDNFFSDWEFVEKETYANGIFESQQGFLKNNIACLLSHNLNLGNSSIEEVQKEMKDEKFKEYSSNIKLKCANLNSGTKEQFLYKINNLKVGEKVEGMTIAKITGNELEMIGDIGLIGEVTYNNDEEGDFYFNPKNEKYLEFVNKDMNSYMTTMFYGKLDFAAITDKQTRQYLFSGNSLSIKINLKKYSIKDENPFLEISGYELIEQNSYENEESGEFVGTE